jgi:hypothetical protein
LELLDSSLAVVLLTGRPLRVQPQTLAWLHRYGLRWDLLVMRERGDYAQVTSFKQRVVGDLRAHGFDLRLAFEDDPSNHAMYVADRDSLRLHPLGLLRVDGTGYYESGWPEPAGHESQGRRPARRTGRSPRWS